MSHDQLPKIGKLTAPVNSNIAMSVNSFAHAEEDGPLQVEAIYFVGGKVQYFYGAPDAFVGFGDNLVFSDGAFQYAFDDEDEDDGLDEEEDEEEGQPDSRPVNQVS